MAISVEARTEIISLVVGMFGAAPGASVLSDLVAAVEAGTTISQLAANLSATAEFKSIYPTFLTNGEYAAKVVANLLTEASVEAKAEATAVLTAAINGGMTRATAMVEAIKFVGATESTNATFGSSAQAFDNKVAVATYYSVDKQLSASSLASLQAVIAGVDNTAASVTAANAVSDGSANVGSSFSFTTSSDTLTGTSGNDTFTSSTTGTADTWTAFDTIDGGAGNDTMIVSTIGTGVPGGASIKNVETLKINTTGAGYAVDASSYTGLEALTLNATSQAAGAISVNGTAATTVSSTGATTGTINVGATTSPTGAVSVSKTIAGAGNVTGGTITVKGGSTVSSTTAATNSDLTGTTVTQGNVTVTGTSSTTSATVKQSATVAAVTAVTAVTESNVVTFGALTAGQTLTLGGLTLTDDGTGATSGEVAAAFASVANGGTGNAGVGTWSGTLTGWSTGSATGNDVTFTSSTANSNVADLAIGGTGSGASSLVKTEGAAGVTGVGGVTAGDVTITDANASSTTAAGTITSASLENFGAATVNSGALATLTLAGKGTSVSETAGALTTATATTLALNLNAVTTTGAVTLDSDHKTVNIAASGSAKSTLASLSASGATAVNVSGDQALTLTAQTLNAAAVVTSTNSAGVTLSTELATGVTFAGGAGKDSIKLGATTKASTLGAGDDTVELSGSALGTAGTVAGGDGSDTLVMTAANAITATASTSVANFSGKVTGFEALQVGATAGAGTINVASLESSSWNAISNVTFSGAVGHATTVSGLASGDTVGFKAANTAATTVGVTGAVASTTDALNVSISNAAGINVNTVNAADIETINFQTDDSATTATGIQHTANLSAAAAKTISVAGDAGLALTNTDTTVTSFDASAVTKGAVSWTTGALAAAAEIKGGAGANTINFSAATKAVTYTGGAAVDTVTANGKDNTINTAGGADVITLGAGANTVDAGDGADTINLGAGLNIVTGGAGTDSFSLTGVTVANGNSYSTITDFAVGETIAFTDAGNYATATLGAKVTLAATAAFADFLQAATAGGTAGELKWFQYGGDTYVVNDASATAAYVNGTDQIIKLTGALDLSASTVANTGVLTYVAA